MLVLKMWLRLNAIDMEIFLNLGGGYVLMNP